MPAPYPAQRDRHRRAAALPLSSLAAAVLMLFHAPHAAAAEPAPVEELQSVTVVGTTPLLGLGTPLTQVPGNVQLFNARQLGTQHNRNLTDFLERNATSVSLNSAQGNPYQPDVNFRGFEASPLLGTPQGLSVFQDGVRINEPFGDTVNWDILAQSAIASMQVIPGSNPLFGLNTLGGALAIQTKSGRDAPGGELEVSAGTFGRKTAQFSQGGVHDRLDYFVTANAANDNGWAEHNSSAVRQFFGKLGYADQDSTLSASLTAADNRLEGSQTTPREFLDRRNEAYTYPDQNRNQATMLSLNGTHSFSDTLQLAANAYYRKFRNDNFSSNVNGGFGALDPLTGALDTTQATNTRSIVDQDSFGFGAQLTQLGKLATLDNQLIVGVSGDFANARFTQYQQDAAFNETRGTFGVSDFAQNTDAQTRNSNLGVFLTDTLALTKQWSVTASARYNHAQVSIADRTGAQPLLNGQHSFSRLNPAFGVTYNPSSWVTAYANYSEGLRAPTAIELACADPNAPCSLPNNFLADPALAPVVAKTTELGARGRLGAKASWNASIFRSELHDDIAFVSSNGAATNTGFFQNVGKTRRQGFEAGVQTQWGPVRLSANYTFLDATYQTAFTESSPSNSSADANGNIAVQPGNQIPGLPRNMVRVRADYAITPAWTLGAAATYRTAVFARGDENNQDAGGKIPGYALLDLDTTYNVTKKLQVFARVNNVFNRHYADFGVLGQNFFNGPGRTFDPVDVTNTQFVGVGTPRGAWVGMRYAWD